MNNSFPPGPEQTQRPNILVILVDQMRYPQWFPSTRKLSELLPSLARLRQGAVSFARHYTAANACTPSRACLLTGLYSHQTGMLTTQPDLRMRLDPGFPTWGSALRGLGYRSYWYGKWHLGYDESLESFGFSGGTFPHPIGQSGEGTRRDPDIVDQFATWLAAAGKNGPWCTTVSLVNPHDIAWYPRGTSRTPELHHPPQVFEKLPTNFETPEDWKVHRKSRQHPACKMFSDVAFGGLTHGGYQFEKGWLRLLDLYLYLLQQMDRQVGRILDILESQAELAANTVVLFTSDHGENGGSHGLRGKSGTIYEEAMRVPLVVRDPRGLLTAASEVEREQMTSSVDLFGLLLTIATGGEAWRRQEQWTHLDGRLDLAAILRDPGAPGRPYILHTSDEAWIEQLILRNRFLLGNPPGHIVCYRTPEAKLGVFRGWHRATVVADDRMETELYDYGTLPGQLELMNVDRDNPGLYRRMYQALTEEAIPRELERPLPVNLQEAQQRGFALYLDFMGEGRSLRAVWGSGSQPVQRSSQAQPRV